MVDHLVERHVAVPAPERERKARARGCEGLEPEAREDLGGSCIPGIGDEECFALVQRAKRLALLVLGCHDRDSRRTASRVLASRADLSGRWRSTRANLSATPPGYRVAPLHPVERDLDDELGPHMHDVAVAGDSSARASSSAI